MVEAGGSNPPGPIGDGMKATAKANANIALVKYWGKRDEALILPHNSSISMTCDAMETVTTVEFSENYDTDTAIINDEELHSDQKRVYDHISLIRKMAGIKEKAKIVSESNFPVAAGLASSASGFAALTVAAAAAAGLKLSEKELSIVARQGSGSACRSIFGGFVEWKKGTKSSDSYAEQIAGKDHWKDFRMIATIVKEARKAVSSRSGMSQTVKTSPYYGGWLSSIEEDLKGMREAIRSKNFTAAGSLAEYNALKMHCTMMTSKPPIIYWTPATVEIMNAVREWRQDLESYFTMDAGPNVKVMCLKKDEKELRQRLSELDGVVKTISCAPGDGSSVSKNHLFD